MPGLTGTELASKMRALRPSIPILLMSGRAEALLHAAANDAGINEVLSKPLHAREIADSLSRAMRAS
jgi:FixJ family two-component response regulator